MGQGHLVLTGQEGLALGFVGYERQVANPTQLTSPASSTDMYEYQVTSPDAGIHVSPLLPLFAQIHFGGDSGV